MFFGPFEDGAFDRHATPSTCGASGSNFELPEYLPTTGLTAIESDPPPTIFKDQTLDVLIYSPEDLTARPELEDGGDLGPQLLSWPMLSQ